MSMKKVWFQLHWILGITAGLILMVVGVTGGMLSFEHEIVRALNKDLVTVQASANQQPLSPEELMHKIQQDYPARQVNGITIQAEPTNAWRINFVDEKKRFGENRYINQYTGEVRWEDEVAHDFLHSMEDLHRRLMQGKTGKQIVGASTIALIILTLSGLYLRWPKTLTSLKTWFTFNTKKTGRSFLSSLHAIAGTWVLIFFLLASITGLFWSYEWYRAGMFKVMNVEQPIRQARQAPSKKPKEPLDEATFLAQQAEKFANFSKAWNLFNAETQDLGYSRIFMRFPQGKADWNFTYFDVNPAHSRARNVLAVNLEENKITQHDRYLDKQLNQKIMSSMLPLHSGEFFGTPFRIMMMLASLSMPLFGITGILLYLDRRRSKKLKNLAKKQLSTTYNPAESDWYILYASQNGNAEKLALQTAISLQTAGFKIALSSLGKTKPQDLKHSAKCLIIASTYGEGGAPDSSIAFAKQLAESGLDLSELNYAVLALGDKNYEEFCGFGLKLDAWFKANQAKALMPITLVNQMCDADLTPWHNFIASQGGELEAFEENSFKTWKFISATELNPASQGMPTFEVKLKPQDSCDLTWQAGDLAEIALENSGIRVYRDYSIANLPSDGYLSLIVRQVHKEQGELGLGSGYLTAGLKAGEKLEINIKSNCNFYLDTTKPVIFIANGTGLAGVKAHLMNRIAQGKTDNWLVFGERNKACDFYFQEDLENWLAENKLQKLSLAFSRDTHENNQPRYVQDALKQEQDLLQDWLGRGASVVVCGSATGMAQAIDELLQETLGEAAYASFIEQNRYLKDVY